MIMRRTHGGMAAVLLPILTLTVLAAFTLAARPAQAQTDFTFTLTNPNIVAPAGTTAVFDGSVRFTGTPQHQGTGIGPYENTYVTNQILSDPAFLSFLFGNPTAGSSYTGALYDISISANAPNGTSITDPGATISVDDTSGTIKLPFSLTVGPAAATATPEPASYAAFAMGGIGLLGLSLKARKRRTAA